MCTSLCSEKAGTFILPNPRSSFTRSTRGPNFRIILDVNTRRHFYGASGGVTDTPLILRLGNIPGARCALNIGGALLGEAP